MFDRPGDTGQWIQIRVWRIIVLLAQRLSRQLISVALRFKMRFSHERLRRAVGYSRQARVSRQNAMYALAARASQEEFRRASPSDLNRLKWKLNAWHAVVERRSKFVHWWSHTRSGSRHQKMTSEPPHEQRLWQSDGEEHVQPSLVSLGEGVSVSVRDDCQLQGTHLSTWGRMRVSFHLITKVLWENWWCRGNCTISQQSVQETLTRKNASDALAHKSTK